MNHVHDPRRTFAERLAARIHVIDFDDGPHLTGLILAGWPPSKPAQVSRCHGLAYFVRDGRPGFGAFQSLPCEDPRELDAMALLARLGETGGYDFHRNQAEVRWPAGTMPRRPQDLPRGPDLFAGIGWGPPWDGADLIGHPAHDLEDHPGRGRIPGALLMAMGMCADRVSAARERFRGALAPASAEAMAFMLARLPTYDPRVLDALLSDPSGGVRAFARRHPLLAMRSLADPEVAARARGGDAEGALRLSLGDELVGAWVVEHWTRHPKSADAVDGSARGNAVDRALHHFRCIPRDQLPMSPGEFAACVEVCGWASAMDPVPCLDRHGPAVRAGLPRARGRWSAVLADVRRVAPGLAGTDRADGPRQAAVDAYGSFQWDLLLEAIHVARGGEGVRRANAALYAWPDRNLGFGILTRGMGVPDMARTCQAYLLARPALAAADRRHAFDLRLGADLPDMPWVAVDRIELQPFRIEAGARSSWDQTDPPDTPITRFPLDLPAAAPGGSVRIWFRVRKEGVPANRLVSVQKSEEASLPADAARYPLWSDVLRAMLATTGTPDENALGCHMIEGAGLAARLAELDDAARSVMRARLADMLAPWRRALPRRLRGLDVDAFAETLAREFEASVVDAFGHGALPLAWVSTDEGPVEASTGRPVPAGYAPAG